MPESEQAIARLLAEVTLAELRSRMKRLSLARFEYIPYLYRDVAGQIIRLLRGQTPAPIQEQPEREAMLETAGEIYRRINALLLEEHLDHREFAELFEAQAEAVFRATEQECQMTWG